MNYHDKQAIGHQTRAESQLTAAADDGHLRADALVAVAQVEATLAVASATLSVAVEMRRLADVTEHKR